MNKKAQTEMIGLVILVVLIVLGLVFYLKFAVLDVKPKLDTSLDQQRAIFIAGAIAKVYLYENVSLQDAVAMCDFGVSDSCGKIKELVPKIVKVSLGGGYDVAVTDKDEKGFSFNASSKGKQVIAVGDCRFGTAGSYPFKSDITSKEYSLMYKIC